MKNTNLKKTSIDCVLQIDDIIRIENDETSKFEKESHDRIIERLDACERAIKHAKREILMFETRASILVQIIRQNNGSLDTTLFSICPMCEMLFDRAVNICSNCGFTENE